MLGPRSLLYFEIGNGGSLEAGMSKLGRQAPRKSKFNYPLTQLAFACYWTIRYLLQEHRWLLHMTCRFLPYMDTSRTAYPKPHEYEDL